MGLHPQGFASLVVLGAASLVRVDLGSGGPNRGRASLALCSPPSPPQCTATSAGGGRGGPAHLRTAESTQTYQVMYNASSPGPELLAQHHGPRCGAHAPTLRHPMHGAAQALWGRATQQPPAADPAASGRPPQLPPCRLRCPPPSLSGWSSPCPAIPPSVISFLRGITVKEDVFGRGVGVKEAATTVAHFPFHLRSSHSRPPHNGACGVSSTRTTARIL